MFGRVSRCAPATPTPVTDIRSIGKTVGRARIRHGSRSNVRTGWHSWDAAVSAARLMRRDDRTADAGSRQLPPQHLEAVAEPGVHAEGRGDLVARVHHAVLAARVLAVAVFSQSVSFIRPSKVSWCSSVMR